MLRYAVLEETTSRTVLRLRVVAGHLPPQSAVDMCRVLNALAPEGIAYRVVVEV